MWQSASRLICILASCRFCEALDAQSNAQFSQKQQITSKQPFQPPDPLHLSTSDFQTFIIATAVQNAIAAMRDLSAANRAVWRCENLATS